MQRIQLSVDGDNLPTEYLGGGISGRITVDEDDAVNANSAISYCGANC